MSSQSESASSLALSLLRTASSPSESFVLSPFSLATALAILHDGAVGEAKEELTQLLLKGHSAEDVSNFYSTLTTLVSSVSGDSKVTATVASRFFLDDSFTLLSDYQKEVHDKYQVDVKKLAFKEHKEAAQTVNSFVNDKTNGRIPNLVDASNFIDAVAVLVNAVHFKAAWQKEFDPSHTKEETFYGAAGERQEKLMYMAKVRAGYHESEGVQVLSLPYADKSFSLLLLLPDSGSFEEFRSSLDGARLQEYITQLSTGKVNVHLPKFTTESSLDGKDALRSLGVRGIFDCLGSLTNVSGDPRLAISAILHKALIEVNEEGTEAAAATAAFAVLRCMPMPEMIPEFRADRPFLYAIVKDDVHVLFIGQFC